MVAEVVRKTQLLSPQERHILAMAAQGLADKQIAVKMGISPGTVRTYWQRMRDKTNSRSRSEILAQCMQKRHAETLEELRESTARLLAVFHGAAVGIALLAREGDILDVNPVFAKLLGVEIGHLIGTQLDRLATVSRVVLLHESHGKPLLILRQLAGSDIAAFEAHRREVDIAGETFSVVTLLPLTISPSADYLRSLSLPE